MAPLRRGACWRRGLTGALALAGVACGDALVDDTYLGTPRFSVHGMLVSSSDEVNEENPRVELALFWSPRGTGQGDTWLQHPGSPQRAEHFQPFHLSVFDEPEARSLVTTPSGARYGIALVAVYRDANGNGRKDEAEPFLGSAHQSALLRSLTDLSAEDSPTGAPLAAGWYRVSLPLACPALRGPPPPGPVAEGNCGVPLGMECRVDGDCGGGLCLKQAAGPWPGGACVIPEPPPNGCRQRGSVLMRIEGTPERIPPEFWIQSCRESADCARAGYQCDPQLRGCRPLNIAVEIDDGRSPPPAFCRGS